MTLPTGALRDDSKNVCEGDYTLYEYRNPFFFTMMHQVVSNFSTWYYFHLTSNHMLYLLQSIWKSWLLPTFLFMQAYESWRFYLLSDFLSIVYIYLFCS